MSARNTYATIGLYSTLLLIIWFLVGCANISSIQGKLDAYIFPVKPDTDQWKQLGSREEMLQAVQIPADQLAAISTPGLVETVLNYPLLADIYVYSSLDQGLGSIKRDFNGMQELMSRQDAGSVLLQKYQATDAQFAAAKQDPLEQGHYATRLQYLELILAQPEIGASLSSQERKLLIQVALRQKEAKQRLSHIYGVNGIEPTALLTGRALLLEQALAPDNRHVRQFLEQNTPASLEVFQHIFDQAASFLHLANETH